MKQEMQGFGRSSRYRSCLRLRQLSLQGGPLIEGVRQRLPALLQLQLHFLCAGGGSLEVRGEARALGPDLRQVLGRGAGGEAGDDGLGVGLTGR